LTRRDGWAVVKSIWWLSKGKANFKNQVTKRVKINIATLPYRSVVLDWLVEQNKTGREIWLVTASEEGMARQVAAHLGIFAGVMGTQAGINLAGKNKAKALVEKFGRKGFDYIGNSRSDLVIWEKADRAHVVTNSRGLVRQVTNLTELGNVWAAREKTGKYIGLALRPHQWVKNLLLLIPMLADHQLNWTVGSKASLGVLVFCLVASAIYLINDMFDLEADRLHPTKKYRPFAAGDLSIGQGVGIAALLLVVGAWLAGQLGDDLAKIVMIYFLLNLCYSLGAKQVVLFDVIILAVLYGLRILAGGAVANIIVSDWLMALILFLALSGALMKRFIELNRMHGLAVNGSLSGRGYTSRDIPLVGQMGMTSGFLAVLVMALYINSTQVNRLYQHPEYWWLVALLLLYGVSRGWLFAYRGKIDDDPIVYIVRDPIYYWIMGLTIILALLAI